MNIAELIEILNKSGEQTQIEAKTATEVGKSILESICAFANEPGLGGGVLVLGVQKIAAEKDYEYKVVGVQPEKLIDDLVSQCRTVFNHPLSIQIHQENLCEKEVVAVTVAEANNGNKPIYFKSQGLPQGAFRRIGCSDVRCTEDDLLVLYQQREFESFDYTPLFDADLDDIDTEAVEDYRKSRAEIHPNAEELHWNDQELLQALGCARKIKQQLVPTVAGILLFGTTKVLRRLFPVMRVDYIRVQGTQWVGDSESRFTSLEARGPMMSTIRRVLTAIVDDLPKAFSLPEGEIQRQDIPIVPSVVIREAVVNALMHRNYRANQSIQIIRYSNRLEIRNPGYSLISDEHLGEPGSKSRNLKIAEALHETRFAEVKGSGIRIMRENMLKAGLSPPLFESDRSRDLFTAVFLFHHFLGEKDLQWLANFRDLQLSDEQARALIFIKEVGAINNNAYRNINQVDTLTASSSLRSLRDVGLLESKNQGAKTYYLPTEKLFAPLAKGHQAEVKGHQLGGKGHQLEGKRHQQGHQPESKRHQLEVKGHQLESKEHQPANFSALPPDLQLLVDKLGKKAPLSKLRNAIVALCFWKEMTSTELAELLKRDKKRLVRTHLTPMVEKKLLVYKYPTMPGHPQQAYKSMKSKI